MSRIRFVVMLAALVATVAALLPVTAGAEPKNELPFTRSVDPRILTQADRENPAATMPRGESKNELPFTRPVSVPVARQSSGAVSNSASFNWTDAAIGASGALAIVLATAAAAALAHRSRRAARPHPAV